MGFIAVRRQTRQKHIVELLLQEADGPLLPQEILGEAQRELPTIGIATIFRILKRMVDEGDAKIVHIPGDSPRYEHIGPSNNHHFKCSECGCVSKVNGSPANLGNL
ncbi:transcriptional repressor [Teredinibacter turnerae]|uniref:Fur family transcriptional regulator n=1 Tax=Teredinibacter turnerae TaxID=2426 RepID=UPI0003645AEE